MLSSGLRKVMKALLILLAAAWITTAGGPEGQAGWCGDKSLAVPAGGATTASKAGVFLFPHELSRTQGGSRRIAALSSYPWPS